MLCMITLLYFSPSTVGNVMLCDGITRESENPGSHALIRYLRSMVHWFRSRALSAWKGRFNTNFVHEESNFKCVQRIHVHFRLGFS